MYQTRQNKKAQLFKLGFSKTPQVGLEPTTLRLTAECSAIELLRKNVFRKKDESLDYGF